MKTNRNLKTLAWTTSLVTCLLTGCGSDSAETEAANDPITRQVVATAGVDTDPATDAEPAPDTDHSVADADPVAESDPITGTESVTDSANSDSHPSGPCIRDNSVPNLKHFILDIESWDGLAGSQAGAILFDSSLTVKPMASFGGFEGAKQLVAMEFKVALGANVYSPLDGIVYRVEEQTSEWWSQDFEILLQPSSTSAYVVSIDHVNNVTLKVGDTVTAGQIIGTTGNWITGSEAAPMVNATFGSVELQINKYSGTSCTDFIDPTNLCPWDVFDGTVVDSYKTKVQGLMADWEAFKSNNGIYDESAMAAPGCFDL